MASLLADHNKKGNIRVSQNTGVPGPKIIAGIDHLLLVLPEKIPAGLWRKVPQGIKVQALMRRKAPGKVPAIATRINNDRQTALHVGTLKPSADSFEMLTFGRKMVAATLSEKAGTVGIWVLGFSSEEQKAIVACVTAAALAAAYTMPSFKSEAPAAKIKNIKAIGLDEKMDFSRVQAEAEGNNLARYLTALPPNKLDANNYVALLQELAVENNWQFKKYSVRDLEKMGAGAFLAVAQGNADDSAAIVRLRYRPNSKSARPALSLVGKGIIFDTGGTNLKPFNSMLDMHIDMGGSAVAIGNLLTLTRLNRKEAVDCWLAITENRTGPTAYKSQDVITALNGKTIQTIHTDAEGRMALADTLVLTCKDKPGMVMDFATLTGACMNAITTRYSGVFTNRPEWHPVLKRTGAESGERVWPFPIGKEFVEDLKSSTADLQQCSPEARGDHILAASFLNEFVDASVPWVHVDLSACKRKGGLAHVPSDITGFGVRYSMNLLIDKNALGDAEWK
ncbi:MAG: leucyl aminopeptidase family protein [Woeseiaceae bacterium]|nr:leucyl aminopeptidase family protein [Woeseiaceae bacterium]